MKEAMYKRLTFSLSYTLPMLVVSGVLFSAGFLFDPPFGSFLIDIGTYAFTLSYALLAAAIAYTIGDRVAIVPALIGGYLLKDGTVGLLGAVVIGFFAGYIVVALKNIFSKVPKLLHGIFPVFIYPVIASLMTIGLVYLLNQHSSDVMLNFYQFLFYDHRWLIIMISMILAGLMAFDLGGPVNKLAYLIAIITMANGLSSTVLAAVIAGGMIPPLSVSLITLFSKSETRKDWWKIGIMGLCFMSEGAISFVQKQHKSRTAIFMIGSAIAGGVVAWFDVTTRIPHGGIFITIFMNAWYWFILALCLGTLISVVLLIIFKPKKQA